MASYKVEICLKKKKTHPEHKYYVTFVSKVGTKTDSIVNFFSSKIAFSSYADLLLTNLGNRVNLQKPRTKKKKSQKAD